MRDAEDNSRCLLKDTQGRSGDAVQAWGRLRRLGGRGWGLDATLLALPAWAVAEISLEFLLEHSRQICPDPATRSLGPSGTGSAHQSVGQMARAFAAWLGRETMVLWGPMGIRGQST